MLPQERLHIAVRRGHIIGVIVGLLAALMRSCYTTDPVSISSENLSGLLALLQAKRLEGRIDVFEMNVERTKPIDIRC